MKYYERLVDMGCFTKADADKLVGNAESAHSLLSAYKKKGLIESVKRDLFVALSLETKQAVPNRFVIASRIAEGAYVSHHSAFEYFGLGNQMYYEVYVATRTRFRTFDYDGLTYRRIAPRIDIEVETKSDGARVTSLERTVIDSIRDFEKIGGLEETLRCVEMVPYLDSGKLLACLSAHGLGFLYQKAGYILGHFKDALKLDDAFFEVCRRKSPQSKRYLYDGLRNETNMLNKDWRLVVPKNLEAVTRKGGNCIA